MLPQKDKHLMLLFAAAVFLVFFSACCRKESCLHRFFPVDGNGWCKDDTLCFNDTLFFPAEDTPRELFLETIVRHNDCYPYEDIHFMVSVCLSNTADSLPPVTFTQLHSLSLVTPRHHWSGEGWGSLRTVTSPPRRLIIPEKCYESGKMIAYNLPDTLRVMLPLKIRVASAMRDDMLPGIESVGIHLYQSCFSGSESTLSME